MLEAESWSYPVKLPKVCRFALSTNPNNQQDTAVGVDVIDLIESSTTAHSAVITPECELIERSRHQLVARTLLGKILVGKEGTPFGRESVDYNTYIYSRDWLVSTSKSGGVR